MIFKVSDGVYVDREEIIYIEADVQMDQNGLYRPGNGSIVRFKGGQTLHIENLNPDNIAARLWQ